MDKGHVGNADETEDGAQIGFLKVKGRPGNEAAAGGHDNCLLAFQQGFDALFGNFKGHVRADNLIDPSLERRTHGEVMHRGADDEHVGSDELSRQFIGVV